MAELTKEEREWMRAHFRRHEMAGDDSFTMTVGEAIALLDAADERDRLREDAAYAQAAVEYAETHTRVQSPQTSSQAAGDRYREARDAFRALYIERHNARTE